MSNHTEELVVPPVESTVPAPRGRRTNPDSFINQVAALDVDETASRTVRVKAEDTSWDAICQVREKSTQHLQNQISRARKKAPGSEFTSSVGDFRSRAGDVYIVVTVTRIK